MRASWSLVRPWSGVLVAIARSAATVLLVFCVTATGVAQQRRIVSLVPALTEMLFAIGAGPQVVGVGSFDAFPPEVKNLPRVGALLDPDTERILSLRPDLVVIYGSQTDLQNQFKRAGITTFVYRHGGIDTIFQTMRELGDATGHRPQADRVVSDLQKRLAAVRARVKGPAEAARAAGHRPSAENAARDLRQRRVSGSSTRCWRSPAARTCSRT